jgi:carboxymethylenebutenolidase
MTEFQRYLAEEIAEDHADGLVSRREALRRLALLGLSAAASAALLAGPAKALAGAKARPTSGPAPEAAAIPAAALQAREIAFRGPRGRTLIGAWAPARRARGGVLVIHENRGLTDSIRAVAGRLAGSGYSALAIDLLSEEGGTKSFADEFEAMAALGAAPPSRFVADLKAGVSELRRRLPGRKVGVTGFCFGGGMTWLLLASREPRVAAAVPFYGPFPEGGSLAGSKAAVLGIYAELDARVNASRAAARRALRKAGLTHQIVTYPDVDHAFFNPTGSRYDADAAAAAYRRMTGWFGRYLAA